MEVYILMGVVILFTVINGFIALSQSTKIDRQEHNHKALADAFWKLYHDHEIYSYDYPVEHLSKFSVTGKAGSTMTYIGERVNVRELILLMMEHFKLEYYPPASKLIKAKLTKKKAG